MVINGYKLWLYKCPLKNAATLVYFFFTLYMPISPLQTCSIFINMMSLTALSLHKCRQPFKNINFVEIIPIVHLSQDTHVIHPVTAL